MVQPHRRHPLWFAFILHRLSGLLLALFLPFHFWVLALALTDPAAFDGALTWSNRPLVKIVEAGLVGLLAAHFLGGLRLLAMELLPWTDRQKSLVVAAIGLSILIAGTFLIRAM